LCANSHRDAGIWFRALSSRHDLVVAEFTDRCWSFVPGPDRRESGTEGGEIVTAQRHLLHRSACWAPRSPRGRGRGTPQHWSCHLLTGWTRAARTICCAAACFGGKLLPRFRAVDSRTRFRGSPKERPFGLVGESGLWATKSNYFADDPGLAKKQSAGCREGCRKRPSRAFAKRLKRWSPRRQIIRPGTRRGPSQRECGFSPGVREEPWRITESSPKEACGTGGGSASQVLVSWTSRRAKFHISDAAASAQCAWRSPGHWRSPPSGGLCDERLGTRHCGAGAGARPTA